MKLSEVKATGTRIEHGAWVDDLPNLPGVAVKVRGAFNSDYNALFSKLAKQYSADELKNDDVQTEIDNDLLLQTILVDWSGIEDFPFNADNARVAVTDPELVIFRRAINYAANNVARLGRASLEEAAKN